MPQSTSTIAQHFADFQWPNGKQCAVALGWHVDGEAGALAGHSGNHEHLTALSEGAYGVIAALPRILDMHRKLDIPGSFFLPAHVAEVHPDAVRQIVDEGHEIALHGYIHENIFSLSEEEERAIFEKSLKVLSDAAGVTLEGWSAPTWGVRQSTIDLLIEHKFLYDSSLMASDMPYLLDNGSGRLVELPISPVLDDWPIFGMSISPDGGEGVNATGESACQIWREEFDGMRHFGGLFTTTFHPNLTGRRGRLLQFHSLLEYMKSFEDVWWATASDVARHVWKSTSRNEGEVSME